MAAVRALTTLGGMASDAAEEKAEMEKLLERLGRLPLAVALAGATIKLYSSHLGVHATGDGSRGSPLTLYSDLLSDRLAERDGDGGGGRSQQPLEAAMALYVEAAVADPMARHTLDLFGACDARTPLPTSTISLHLSKPWFGLPPLPLLPTSSLQAQQASAAGRAQGLPGSAADGKLAGGTSNSGFLSRLKAALGYAPLPSSPDEAMGMAVEDPVSFLRDSPLLSFRRYRRSGVELVHVHEAASPHLVSLFLGSTRPWLERGHLDTSEEEFQRTAWFRSYRSFDPGKSIAAYRLSLPGVSSPGVLTQRDVEQSPPTLPPALGGACPSPSPSRLPREVGYAEYLHLVSHWHRVVESLAAEVKAGGGDSVDVLIQHYVCPHLRACARRPFLAETDALSCAHCLLRYEAATLEGDGYDETYRRFESLLERQRALHGSLSPVLARTQTDMANLKWLAGDLPAARRLLEAALAIYEKLPQAKRETLASDVGLALASLGIVCSQLGEKRRSVECLEAALVAHQTVAPGQQISAKQRKIVATLLTDVAHTYVSLGELDAAKKYIELALMAHPNVYPDIHPEMVRALNVSSIVFSLLGDKRQSSRNREEAGKIQAKLDSQPSAL